MTVKGFLGPIIALVAVVSLICAADALAHNEVEDDNCNNYVCVTMDGKKITVARNDTPETTPPPFLLDVLAITVLRDNTQERFWDAGKDTCDTVPGPEPDGWQPGDLCSYDDSQRVKRSDTLDYECHARSNTIRVYTIYAARHKTVDSFPDHSGTDMQEVWDHGLKLDPECT